jgi:hypothetical protein
VICPVQSLLKKYSSFPKQRSILYLAPSRPTEGRWPSSLTRGGMRWTRAALLTRARACGRQSRVVLTPRRWRQVRGGIRETTETKEPELRGEHEISRKPLRAGMPGDFRWTCGDYARVLFTFCTRGCGCIGRPAFPTPSSGRMSSCMTRTQRAAGSRSCVIARSESDEAIQLSFSLRQSWIASLTLAMTVLVSWLFEI